MCLCYAFFLQLTVICSFLMYPWYCLKAFFYYMNNSMQADFFVNHFMSVLNMVIFLPKTRLKGLKLFWNKRYCSFDIDSCLNVSGEVGTLTKNMVFLSMNLLQKIWCFYPWTFLQVSIKLFTNVVFLSIKLFTGIIHLFELHEIEARENMCNWSFRY